MDCPSSIFIYIDLVFNLQNGITSSSQSIVESDEDSAEQAFSAACKVVCEWANKLLGRCFETLLGLAKFLVNGSYVSTKSMSAFIVMSASQDCLTNIKQKYSLIFFIIMSFLFYPEIKSAKRVPSSHNC